MTTRRGALRRSAVLLGALLLLALRGGASAQEHAFESDATRAPALKTGGSCVVRGATIHSAIGAPFEGDLLVEDGRIAAIGAVPARPGLVEIDARGRHLAPGVVNGLSHLAIEGGRNAGHGSVSAERRIDDAIDAEDIAIYRALAGGVTTARLSTGSTDAIGAQDAIVKLKWNRSARELAFPGAPRGIELASGAAGAQSPATRMGFEALHARAFERAREYAREWDAYEAARAAGQDPVPPRRDLRLEALVLVLQQELVVHGHAELSDGILSLIRLAQRFGFRIATLQHALEGYKVAFELAAAGVPGAACADCESPAVLARDAIPQNASLMDRARGGSASLGSHSDERVRRMYCEAANSARSSRMDPVRALALVTLFPARQLGIGDRVGSIEVGKDADVALLDGPPLSWRTRVLWTMVDGEVEFERRDAFGLDAGPPAVRELAPSSVAPVAYDPAGPTPIALVGGTVHPIEGPPLERGSVLLQGERVLAVGIDLALPDNTRVERVDGLHVWPGLIALDTSLGLEEAFSLAGTSDGTESDGNRPELRAVAAVDAASVQLAEARQDGVTRAQTVPPGGGPVRGQSCVLDLFGETREELLFLDRDMLHVSFPDRPARTGGAEAPDEVAALRELFARAREHGLRGAAAQASRDAAPRSDPRLAALAPYALGAARVALHADDAATILQALRFARELGLDAVLFGAGEGWKVAEAIARERMRVVVGPVLAVPRSRFDPYDAPFANAAVLARAGVEVAIASSGDRSPRSLALHAAQAAAFGLPEEEALRAITLYPARFLGLDDRLGSLVPGKLADLIVTDGPLLEASSRVQRMFLAGRAVDLEDSPRNRLYLQYARRLERLEAEGPPR